MTRRKLQRFEENKTFDHVIEPHREDILKSFPLKGNWGNQIFGNDNPLILELGCGKGEYTVAMAKRYPEQNFVGVDVKGSRIWYGAKQIDDEKIENAAFLRCQIELIDHCFAPDEVSEIWITFPDPQIKHKRSKHRLTYPSMLRRYKKILKSDGLIHLKTDSEFLYGYTSGLLHAMNYPILESWYDIDKQVKEKDRMLHQVTTYYEGKFREQGKPITYLKFSLPKDV